MNTYLSHPTQLYHYFADPTRRHTYLTYIGALQRHGPYAEPEDILQQVIESLSGIVPPSYTTYDQWIKASCRLIVRQARWKFYNRPSECKTVYGLSHVHQIVPESNEKASNLIERGLPYLTAKQREIVERIYYSGDSRATIARDLGCSPQSVELTHQRALRRLKKVLLAW